MTILEVMALLLVVFLGLRPRSHCRCKQKNKIKIAPRGSIQGHQGGSKKPRLSKPARKAK